MREGADAFRDLSGAGADGEIRGAPGMHRLCPALWGHGTCYGWIPAMLYRSGMRCSLAFRSGVLKSRGIHNQKGAEGPSLAGFVEELSCGELRFFFASAGAASTTGVMGSYPDLSDSDPRRGILRWDNRGPRAGRGYPPGSR